MKLVSLALLLSLAATGQAQDRLYVLSSSPTSPNLIELDPVSGAQLSSVPVSGHEALFGGLAIDAAGSFFSIDGYNDPNPDRTFRIDPATGVGAVVGQTGFNWNFRCVSVDPTTDVLYGWRDNELFTVDRTTGAATPVATVSGPSLDQGTALAISPTGMAYITDIGDKGLFEIELATGNVTFLGDLMAGGGSWFSDLDFDSAGNLWGAFSQGGVFRIDVVNATAQSVLSGTYTGLAFVLDGEIGTSYCGPAAPNSTGLPARISAAGSTAVAANNVALRADDLPPGQFGYFLAGQTQGFFNPAGSQGFICLQGTIGRYNQAANIIQGPTGSIALDLQSIPVSPPVAVVPGETWSFQCWFRDNNPGLTSNFTDGVEILFQ
ncbi:MAG: hypothetical protein GY711_00705 [bacterium]|nr:hypothetical protein [bacterium]